MRLFTKWRLMLMAMLLSSFGAKAVGWPANYEGVMLQGFYWDSYTETSWKNLKNQADELSKYFKLIWIPNSAQAEGKPTMGYHPVYWFTNHNSSFGTEAELRDMIATYKAKGTGFIADVVINHRSGVSNWTNFPTETWNGKTYKIGPEGICSGDEVRNASGQATPTGAADTGENWDGARDLDHTNANVQANCKDYIKCLLTDFGYAGVRYDFVKGYGAQYTKMYNQANNVKYSVGEYWDGNYDAVKGWIEGTGRESAAFDFPFKYQLNKAFNGGAHNYAELVWMANGSTPQPAGMIHSGYPQLAVTFVDNHDTYRDGSKYTGDVLLANAFMLASPGTPCVFYPHYKQYKSQIQAMIDARNGVGINNTSTVNVLEHNGACYVAEVTGTKGKLFIKMGNSSRNPGSGYTKKASGNGYEIWTTSEGGQSGGGEQGGGDTTTEVNIYFKNDKGWATPYIYHWGGTEATWPGVAMQKHNDVWKYTCPAGTTGILFNAGDGDATKTDDFVAVNNHLYSTTADLGVYSGSGGGEQGGGGTTTAPATLYVIGEVDGNVWAYDLGTQLTKSGNKFYGDVTVKGEAATATDGYFSFAVKLADSWDNLNASGNRYAPSVDTKLELNGTAPLTAAPSAETKAYYCANGEYAIIVDFDSNTVKLAPKGTKPEGGGGTQGGGGGNTGNVTMPDALYIVGNIPGCQWDPNQPVAMEKGTSGFLAKNVEITDGYNGNGYFSFLTVKAALPADFETDPQNPFDWDGPNGGNSGDRYGSEEANAPLALNGSATMVCYEVGVNASAATSWMTPVGTYDIIADFKTMTVKLVAAGTGTVPNEGESGGGDDHGSGGDETEFPEELYILGDLPDHNWQANYGFKMTKNGGEYTASNVEFTTAYENDYGYFSFASKLGTTPTDWDGDGTTGGVNGGTRYGSTGSAAVPPLPGVDIEIKSGDTLDIVEFTAGVNASACASWKVLPGTYDIKADLKNMKITLTTAGGSSVEAIGSDYDGEVEYYNLQGIRVYEPSQGIYIVRRGSKVTKEVVR